MSQIPNFKKLNPEDFPEIPKAIYPVLEVLNDSFETIYKALQGDLTRESNLGQEKRQVSVSDEVPFEIELQDIKGRARCVGVFPLNTGDPYQWGATEIRPGLHRVTVVFNGSHASPEDCDVFFESTEQ